MTRSWRTLALAGVLASWLPPCLAADNGPASFNPAALCQAASCSSAGTGDSTPPSPPVKSGPTTALDNSLQGTPLDAVNKALNGTLGDGAPPTTPSNPVQTLLNNPALSGNNSNSNGPVTTLTSPAVGAPATPQYLPGDPGADTPTSGVAANSSAPPNVAPAAPPPPGPPAQTLNQALGIGK
jgi:hypothetical protein